jgi:hypothetical protein
MALTDIIMNGKYLDDSSSSSSLGSDSESDEISSSSSDSSLESSRDVALALSDAEGDSDLEANVIQKPLSVKKAHVAPKPKPKPNPTSKRKPKPKPKPALKEYEHESNSSNSSGSCMSSSENEEMGSKSASATPSNGLKADDSQSLKFTLKLPPSLLSNSGGASSKQVTPRAGSKIKVEVTNTKKAKTGNGTAKSKKTTGPRKTAAKPRAKTTPKTAVSPAAKKKAESPTKAATAPPPLPTPPPPLPQHAVEAQLPVNPLSFLPPQLVPNGPTIPKEEIRGAKELSFTNPQLSASRPPEIEEKDIPPHFNDQHAQGDVLRNLDLFFFCDKKG